jgi:hypothetical protein
MIMTLIDVATIFAAVAGLLCVAYHAGRRTLLVEERIRGHQEGYRDGWRAGYRAGLARFQSHHAPNSRELRPNPPPRDP